MKLYVVQVTHTGGSTRDVAVPALITENAAVALTAAFGAEEAGYRFFARTGEVRIFRVETEKVYGLGKPSPGGSSGGTFPETCVFTRRRNPNTASGWQEFWFDTELQRTYGKVFAPLTA